MKALIDYLVNVGPHPWQDEGWQIAFDFGAVQVSIAQTPETRGVELMVWGMFEKPLEYVTPEQALVILRWLMTPLSLSATSPQIPLRGYLEGEIGKEGV